MLLKVWNWTGQEMRKLGNRPERLIIQLYLAILEEIHLAISRKMLNDAKKAGCDDIA